LGERGPCLVCRKKKRKGGLLILPTTGREAPFLRGRVKKGQQRRIRCEKRRLHEGGGKGEAGGLHLEKRRRKGTQALIEPSGEEETGPLSGILGKKKKKRNPSASTMGGKGAPLRPVQRRKGSNGRRSLGIRERREMLEDFIRREKGKSTLN